MQKWLQEEKQDVNHCRGGKPEGTALHWAALCGKTEIAKLLLSEGASTVCKCEEMNCRCYFSYDIAIVKTYHHK